MAGAFGTMSALLRLKLKLLTFVSLREGEYVLTSTGAAISSGLWQ